VNKVISPKQMKIKDVTRHETANACCEEISVAIYKNYFGINSVYNLFIRPSLHDDSMMMRYCPFCGKKLGDLKPE